MRIKVKTLGSGQFSEYGDENADAVELKSPADVYGADEEYKEIESPYYQSRRGSRDRKDQDAFNKMEL